MSERISLSAQIAALHSNILSRQGYLRQADILAENPKHAARIAMESLDTRNNQPALEAALETLRWMKAHEADIRAFVAERGRGA
jgi:hypothetical protein